MLISPGCADVEWCCSGLMNEKPPTNGTGWPSLSVLLGTATVPSYQAQIDDALKAIVEQQPDGVFDERLRAINVAKRRPLLRLA